MKRPFELYDLRVTVDRIEGTLRLWHGRGRLF